MIMEMILMPLNIMRLYEMMRLVSSVSSALDRQSGGPDLYWLAPHMRRIRLAPQQILFSRGDAADRLFIVLSGEVMLTQSGTIVTAGEMIGEAGLFDPGQLQSQTCQCIDSAEIGEIKQSLIAELYFQNPMFGYRLAQFAIASMRSRLEARSYSSSSCAGAAAMPRAAM
jgi:CRP/FNR family cyclic AMP-dependent transcriptional regulator